MSLSIRTHKHRAYAGMARRLDRYRLKNFAWAPSLHWQLMFAETHAGFRLLLRQVDGPVWSGPPKA